MDKENSFQMSQNAPMETDRQDNSLEPSLPESCTSAEREHSANNPTNPNQVRQVLDPIENTNENSRNRADSSLNEFTGYSPTNRKTIHGTTDNVNIEASTRNATSSNNSDVICSEPENNQIPADDQFVIPQQQLNMHDSRLPNLARPHLRSSQAFLFLAQISYLGHEILINNLNLFSESGRRQSFGSWPFSNNTCDLLARSGFLYLGNLDRIQCFFCSRVFGMWLCNQDITSLHRMQSPLCSVATAASSIPISPVERSAVPAPPNCDTPNLRNQNTRRMHSAPPFIGHGLGVPGPLTSTPKRRQEHSDDLDTASPPKIQRICVQDETFSSQRSLPDSPGSSSMSHSSASTDTSSNTNTSNSPNVSGSSTSSINNYHIGIFGRVNNHYHHCPLGGQHHGQNDSHATPPQPHGMPSFSFWTAAAIFALFALIWMRL